MTRNDQLWLMAQMKAYIMPMKKCTLLCRTFHLCRLFSKTLMWYHVRIVFKLGNLAGEKTAFRAFSPENRPKLDFFNRDFPLPIWKCLLYCATLSYFKFTSTSFPIKSSEKAFLYFHLGKLPLLLPYMHSKSCHLG